IPEYVAKAYRDAGVQINMILFHSSEGEMKSAEKQFSIIETLPTPGTLMKTADTVKLKEHMGRSLRRELRCRLEKNGVPVGGAGQESVLVGPLSGAARWFAPLVPHVYAIRAHLFRQDIDIGPGDFIQVAMLHNPQNREINFERALLARNYPTKDKL